MILALIFIDPLAEFIVYHHAPEFKLDFYIIALTIIAISAVVVYMMFQLIRKGSTIDRERQLLQDQFNSLTKYMNDGVVLIDEQRRIIEANDRILTMYGYTREELSTLDPIMFRVPGEQEKFDEQFPEAFTGRGHLIETLHQRKDGTTFYVEVSARLFKRDGKHYFQSIIRDISERKRNEEMLQRQSARLRSLAVRAERIREEERKTLARELHDQLGQELTAIKMNIAVLASHAKHDELMTAKIQYLRELVDMSIHSTRRISTSLRPDVLDQLGLDAAITWQVREFEKQYGISCTHKVERVATGVKEGVSIALIRILQESLTNVIKHAQATQVAVTLEVQKRDLRLNVYDNGKGIAAGSEEKMESFGILGMKERANAFGGSVTVEAQAASGTRVIVQIPEALK